MRSLSPRLLMILTLCIGGGSLVVFGYFLAVRAPFSIGLTQSDAGRLAFDSLLCMLFFVQHSGMVRRGAKERIAKHVPGNYNPAIYSIASGIALLAVVILWQPTDRLLYSAHGLVRWLLLGASAAAIAGFAWGAGALGSFDPFGTQALKDTLRGTASPAATFVVRGPYRYVRHPLYLFMLVFIWSTYRLSIDRLLFNVLWTAWIVVGSKLEERDLLHDFGPVYREYQESVPMLLPIPLRRLQTLDREVTGAEHE